jgi:hypothetical protein
MNRVRVLFVAVVVTAVMVIPAFAQQVDPQSKTPPLVQVLQSKGILTAAEAAQIAQATSAAEANDRLAQMLLAKGLISESDYNSSVGPLVNSATVNDSNGGHFMNSVVHVGGRNSYPTPITSDMFTYGAPGEAGGVIPAVAPIRLLPIDVPKQGGLIPDLSLGSGARIKLYGFFKASAAWDAASSGGGTFGANDFPLPLLIGGQTGPTTDPQVHIKARSTRIGTQFEWVPKNSDLVVTGRMEMDWEGDYTTVNNRNVSSDRNSQLTLRLAYVRLDTKFADIPVYAEFGQDWTLLASSTMMNIFETTQLGAFFGNIYERAPQIKVGTVLGSGDYKIGGDFAIQQPIAGSSTLTADQRSRFGDRAGSESDQPAVEGRIVFQFPINKGWSGVAPAQLIVSGHHAQINEIVPGQAITAASSQLPPIGLPNVAVSGATCPGGVATGVTVLECYPHGAQFNFPQNIFTVEAQVPTPWATVVAKWHKGADLRFFFGGETAAALSNPGVGPGGALVSAGEASSFSGTSIFFGCPSGALIDATCNGPITPGVLAPIRGQGGFVQVSFPLSRIFNANPEGRNAGWVLAFTYGTDRADRRDQAGTTAFFEPQIGGNGLIRTDMGVATLSYKINKWVSFVNEVTWYQTRTGWQFNDLGVAGVIRKPFGPNDVTAAHDWRNEFGTVVTF